VNPVNIEDTDSNKLLPFKQPYSVYYVHRVYIIHKMLTSRFHQKSKYYFTSGYYIHFTSIFLFFGFRTPKQT